MRGRDRMPADPAVSIGRRRGILGIGLRLCCLAAQDGEDKMNRDRWWISAQPKGPSVCPTKIEF